MALWEADWDGKGPRPTAARPLGDAERKRNMQLGALALAAAILIAAGVGYVLYRYPKRAANSGAPAPVAFQPRQSVAVLAFKNIGSPAEDWIGGALPVMLDTELGASIKQLRTISGEDVATSTADLALPVMPSYGKSTLAKLRGILKSDYVVAGSYLATGNEKSDSIRLDVRLQDATSGDIVSSIAEAGTVGGISDLSAQVGAAVRKKLGIPDPSESESAQAQAALPADPEATRLYTEGLAKLRTLDALGAKDSLERAIKLDPDLPGPHAALAQAWQLLGYDSNARDEAKKAMDLSAHISEVDQDSIQGRYRELTAEWDKAIDIYHSLWHVYHDEPNYALDLAKAQTSAGKGQDALATLAELQHLPNMSDDPRVDLAQAFAYESLSDVKRQRDAAASAAQKASRLGSRYLAAQAYWQECAALFALGELPKATEACRQSTAAAPSALEIEARTKTVLANIQLAQGNTSETLALRQEALDTARKIGSQKDVIGALDHLANIVDVQGNTAQARQYFDEALRVAHEIADKQQILEIENDYAADLYGDGDLAGAEELYDKSLSTAREIGDQQGAAMALQNLSLVLLLKGDLAGAQQQIDQAIGIQRKGGLQSDLANSLDAQGELFLARNDLAGARKSYEESLKISTQLNSPAGIASSRASLAELALADGKPSDAEKLARRAAQEFQQENLVDQEADARDVLAKSLLAEGKVSDAQAEVDRARSLPVQDRAIRMSLTITAARLKARSGDAAGARKDLDACMADAVKMKLVGTVFDIALADAELLGTSDPKSAAARLQALQGDATARGFLRVAADARHASEELTHKKVHSG
jgi:eukaryotic-like serine/threonine-protein kinase